MKRLTGLGAAQATDQRHQHAVQQRVPAGQQASRAGLRPPPASPGVMASLRNLAVGALRLSGHPNLAAALRHTGRDPAPPLAVLGLAYR
jgi:hypothetical protein